MFGLQKTILVLSDEAVAVYSPVRGRFSFLGEVKWQDSDFISVLTELLAGKARGRPITILYDMVEQYYRREIVPRVAVLDQRRVLERRLQSAFTNYPYRAFLPLKYDKKAPPSVAGGERTGASDGKSKGFDGIPYLFAALPDHDQISRVIESVRLSMTVARTIALLPVEAVSMVRQLSGILNDGDKNAERWTVFMAQHRGGGLRQIVVRNGELALTRLTPIVDTDIEPGIWANEVAQEFSATMGYLSRFGYNNASELEVIVIGNPDAVSQLEPQIKASVFHGMSLVDAARSLRLNVDTGDDTRYADVLHAAWSARKLSATLPFEIRELSFISTTRLVARGIATLLCLTVLGGFGYVGQQGLKLKEAWAAVEKSSKTLKVLEQEYNAELKRKEEFNIDVKLVQGSIAIFDQLEKNKIDILKFLQDAAASMTPDLSFDNIKMGYQVIEQENPDPMAIQTVQKKKFFAKMELSFPDTIKPEIGNKLVSDLRERMAKNMPGFTVTVDQSVQDLTFRSQFEYESGQDVDKVNDENVKRLTAVIGVLQELEEK